MLAFDILSTQPMNLAYESRTRSMLEDHNLPSGGDKKTPSLLFPVENFFAVGSPLGVILLLRGYKVASRKSLEANSDTSVIGPSNYGDMSSSDSSISFCYPAVNNLYNVFHKASVSPGPKNVNA